MHGQRLNISCLLELAKTHTKGFSSSRIKIDPTIKVNICISPDYPQLLELRDSSGNIPCVCPDFSLDILCATINATRWYLTCVENSKEFNLPTYYLEIGEYQIVDEVTLVDEQMELTVEKVTHSIVKGSVTGRYTLCGVLLQVYPIFKLDQLTYLALFQVVTEKVYIFFVGDDFLSLHSLLKANYGYIVTNIILRLVKDSDTKIKTFITTEDSSVMTKQLDPVDNDVINKLHDGHTTIEELVTQIIDFEAGHFLLNSSLHLILTHFPSSMPVWGLRAGARVRISQVQIFSLKVDGTPTQFAWCCHHTRIELVATSKRPRAFLPYLPHGFITRNIFSQLTPSSAFLLSRIVGLFKKYGSFSYNEILALKKLFDLDYLDNSTIKADIRRLIFSYICIVTPFREVSPLSFLTLSQITSPYSIEQSCNEFFRDFHTFKPDLTIRPIYDRQSYYSLVEDSIQGYVVGRVELCSDTGHIVLTDSEMKLPIIFTKGVLPSHLIQTLGSLVAIKDYVLTVVKTSFPGYIHNLTQAHISTCYDKLITIKQSPKKLNEQSTYILLITDKTNIVIDSTPLKKNEYKFQVRAKVYLNCISSSSQTGTIESMVGELCFVFSNEMVKWWHLIEVSWIYHWSGYDSSQVNPYLIDRSTRVLFQPTWSLYPIGDLPAKPLDSPDNDIITLFTKVREGQTRCCLINGLIQRVLYMPCLFPKSKLVNCDNEWFVEMWNTTRISLSELHKHGYSFLPVFYTLQLALTFPVTDAVYLSVYIDLPQCRMPLNLQPGAWVTLTGVKIKLVNNYLRGNIDCRGTVSVDSHPRSHNLLPSIYKKLRPLSPDNFNTFRCLCIRVDKFQMLNEQPQQQLEPDQPPTRGGLYSNKFAICRTQRYHDLEKSRYMKMYRLLHTHKVLRISLRLEAISNVFLSKHCFCCKTQDSHRCPSASVRVQAVYFAYVGGYKAMVKAVNRCTVLLKPITESQIQELGGMLEDTNSLDVDRSFFETAPRNSYPSWFYSWFSDTKFPVSSIIDGIVTHTCLHTDQNPEVIAFQLTLHHFKDY